MSTELRPLTLLGPAALTLPQVLSGPHSTPLLKGTCPVCTPKPKKETGNCLSGCGCLRVTLRGRGQAWGPWESQTEVIV
jgi:hypothetical protein